MGDKLAKAMEIHKYTFDIFGFKMEISETIITMWIVMAFLIITAFFFARKLKEVPKGKQNFAELIVEFVNNFMETNMGHHGKAFAPYFGSVLLLLAFSNIISIFNIIPNPEEMYNITGWSFWQSLPEFELKPPTNNVNLTAALAIVSILLVLVSAIKIKGVGGWLKSFAEPLPLLIPFKILDYFVRPLSLCFRLFGNILGGFIVMELLYAAFAPLVPAVFSIYFDLFDGGLQAYIFVFLSSLYIAEAIE